MRKYDLAIFDLDGTILDTSAGILAAVQYTIDKFGFAPLSDDVLQSFIGPPIQDSFARAYHFEGDILQDITNVFRSQYKNVDLLKAAPYDGMYDALGQLSDAGVINAVATYKPEDFAVTLLKHFHFDRYFNIMHGADHENQLKKKDIIELCIAESGVTDKSRIVMIGDTAHDAVGAEQEGIDFIAVTFGFGFRSEADAHGISCIGCAHTAMEILNDILLCNAGPAPGAEPNRTVSPKPGRDFGKSV